VACKQEALALKPTSSKQGGHFLLCLKNEVPSPGAPDNQQHKYYNRIEYKTTRYSRK